ncbi:hypothetical protein D9M71_692950 [compost metagenome]
MKPGCDGMSRFGSFFSESRSAGRGKRVIWHSLALSFCMRTEASVLMAKIRLSIFTSPLFQ